MKTRNLILTILATIPLMACGNTSSVSSSKSSSESKPDFENLNYVDDLLWLPDFKIEVEQKYYIQNYYLEFADPRIYVVDETVAKIENKYLVGVSEGSTYLVYENAGVYQRAKIDVAPKGSYKRAWNFASSDLAGKNVCNFGDSVSYDWSLGEDPDGEASSVYCRRVAAKYKMNFVYNYAIGGSVAQYVTFAPNVYEEYHGTDYQYNDGCDQFYKLLTHGTLDTMDYIFITYACNDCYFQPDLDAEGDDVVCYDSSFASCHSWKGCYRYMINVARHANPNVRVILMGPHYTEYDYDHGYFPKSYHFDKGLRYPDYRNALYELSIEMDVKFIDSWNHMKGIYDYTKGMYDGKNVPVTANYFDEMHPSVLGHKKWANYVSNN